MNPKHLSLLLSALVISGMLAVPAFCDEAAVPAAPAGPLKIGDVLGDDIKVSTMDGKSVTLKSQATAPYTIFQFMTTACSACQTELNKLLELQMEIGKDKVAIFPIAMDMMGADAVKAYEAKYNYGMNYLLDSMFAVPPRFGLAYTPSFIILDASGTLLFQKGGFIEGRWPKDLVKIMAIFK